MHTIRRVEQCVADKTGDVLVTDHRKIGHLPESVKDDTLQTRLGRKYPLPKIGRRWHFRKRAFDHGLAEK